MSTPTPHPVRPDQLPAAVRTFLAAHAARDVETAVRALVPTATVTDEGRTFTGTEEVLGFLRHSGSEFEYTSEVTGARRDDETHWVVSHRLEGDFPGGVADLDYRFTMAGDLVADLVIAP